jgi:DNA adenine methylase
MSQHPLDVFLRRRPVLSPLRYPGGKRRLAPYITALLDLHGLEPGVFVEPYAGGASVGLELLHFQLIERLVLGDRDPMIIAFWQTVRDDVDWLCRQVEQVDLDLDTWRRMKRGRFRSRRSLALACLYLNRTSFNGSLHRQAGPIGGQTQASDYAIGCRFPRQRLVRRLRACSELSDRIDIAQPQEAMKTVRQARDHARQHDMSAFFYLDPPFWDKSQRLYRYGFTETEHERLADALHWVKDPFVLSYDAAPEIVELYKGHRGRSIALIELLYTGTARSAGQELVISNLDALPHETRLWRTKAEWLAARSPARSARTRGDQR